MPIPQFEIVRYKDMGGFYVLVTWPDGDLTRIERRDKVPAFFTKNEAQHWIVAHRNEWLASAAAKMKLEYAYID